MEKKTFYSIIQENRVVGVRKQDGYEVSIDGMKFNAYRSKVDGMVYILDPDNGIALSVHGCMGNAGDTHTEAELIGMAREELAESGGIEKWKEVREEGRYQLTVQMFEAYRRAESLREQYCRIPGWNGGK